MNRLINNIFVVDCDHCCEQFVFVVAIVLVRSDVGQPKVGLVFNFDIESIALCFVVYCQLKLQVSANHNDWPQPILIKLLAFDLFQVFAKLHFSKLS